MITVYNTASSFYWYPLRLISSGNQLESAYTKYFFDNGMIINAHNFLYQGMDYSYNRQTALFLTDVLSAGELFKNTELPAQNYDLTQIISPMTDQNGFTLTVSPVQTSKGIINCITKTNRDTISNADVLKFVVDDTDKNLIFIENNNDYVLQCDGLNPTQTYFAPKIRPYINEQRFEYYLSDNGQICLFRAGSDNTLALSIQNNILSLKNVYLPFNYKVPNDITFKLTSYSKVKTNYDSMVNSRIVEYNNSPIDPIDSLNKNTTLFNKEYFQNYLIMFGGENPNIIDEEAVYEADFLSLKNYQTAEYDYTDATTYVQENTHIRRIYWQIFTGTNQEKGLDNVYLGYTSDTTKLYLPADTYTEFQYPPGAPRTPLSANNLIKSGAISGEHPLVSDRIYASAQNYKNMIPVWTQPPSFIRETGTWLCSWLKSNKDGSSQWMDRYYNAAYYTIDNALTAQSMNFVHRLDPIRPYVYDSPSTMGMEPGARYKYFRQGQNSAKEFLPYLDYTPENPKGSKILDIQDWSGKPLLDSSPYKNDGLIVKPLENENPKDYFIFNGSNHIIFPAKSLLLESQKLTVSLWLKVEDWSNLNGWQIVGNYYNGGWGLINNAGQIAPLMTISEGLEKRLYTINYRSGLADSFDLSNYGDANFEYILRLQDFNSWIIDTKNLKIYKIDNNGKIIIQDKNILSSRVTRIDQAELDKNENVVLMDKKTGVILKINSNGDQSSILTGKYINRFEIDLNNNIVYCDSVVSVIDNYNNLWEIIGGNLYYSQNYNSVSKYYTNKIVKGYVGKCQQITCDSDNNIWMLTWDNFLIKYNISTEKFEINKKLLDDYLDPCDLPTKQYSYINFLRTPADEFNKDCRELQKSMYDIIVVVDTLHYKLYKFQTNGTLILRTDLRTYIQNEETRFEGDWKFNAAGDFTGFHYIRKFNNHTTRDLSWKFKVSDPLKNDKQLISLTHNISGLPPGWHNFAFTFDTLMGESNYYIDSVKVASSTFPKNWQLTYDYTSPLLVGATSIKNTSLNDVLSIEDGYKFKGQISNLKVYNKSLNAKEIEQIYFSSPYSIQRQNLNWNIIIGDRNYIERIDHVYKYQMPGSKSNYYNINIHNFEVSDDLKKIVETAIKNNIETISPSNTYLNKINWL
jgi:hypothetical protein